MQATHTTPPIKAYILAKNEEPNIGKCLSSLAPCGIPVLLLDSGSTDGTKEIARRFTFCEVANYSYVDHATAYNWITSTADAEYALILDADMEVPPALWAELLSLVGQSRWDVVRAPVQMFVEGRPLRFGSLCPPKAILFRCGSEYFVPRGHGEALRPDLQIRTTRCLLPHNDLKSYETYLASQARYGANLAKRHALGKVSLKDRFRAATPFMALIYGFVSLVLRGGLLSGRRGLLYALDRAIAVLVQYRVVMAYKDRATRGNEPAQSISQRSGSQ